LYTNYYYPGHVYGRDGKILSLSGPEVDHSKILKNKITKAGANLHRTGHTY